MPPSLPTLPAELILEVLSYLRHSDVESVAKTFNSCLTPACLHLIEYRIAARRNTKRMISLFKEPKCQGYYEFSQARCYNEMGLEQEWGPFFRLDNSLKDYDEPFQEVLDFDGSLGWLKPHEYDEALHNMMIGQHEWKRIEEAADRLDLKPPKAFITFMRGPRSWFRVRGGEFKVPDKIFKYVEAVKLSSEDKAASADGRGESSAMENLPNGNSPQNPVDTVAGYILKFFESQGGSDHYSLYLDASEGSSGPGHCVICSVPDPSTSYMHPILKDSMTAEEIQYYTREQNTLGIDEEIKQTNSEVTTELIDNKVNAWVNELKEEFGAIFITTSGLWADMVNTSFEEWIAQVYFDQLCCYAEDQRPEKIPACYRQRLIDMAASNPR